MLHQTENEKKIFKKIMLISSSVIPENLPKLEKAGNFTVTSSLSKILLITNGIMPKKFKERKKMLWTFQQLIQLGKNY